jgi:hypothetical protein
MPPMSIRRRPAAAAEGNGKGRGRGIGRLPKAKAKAKAKAKGTGKGILHRPPAARVDPVALDVATEDNTVHTLHVDGQDTMETIKVRLLHLLGWPLPADAITLHCGFLELEHHRTLASYGIGMGHRQLFIVTMVPEVPEEPL